MPARVSRFGRDPRFRARTPGGASLAPGSGELRQQSPQPRERQAHHVRPVALDAASRTGRPRPGCRMRRPCRATRRARRSARSRRGERRTKCDARALRGGALLAGANHARFPATPRECGPGGARASSAASSRSAGLPNRTPRATTTVSAPTTTAPGLRSATRRALSSASARTPWRGSARPGQARSGPGSATVKTAPAWRSSATRRGDAEASTIARRDGKNRLPRAALTMPGSKRRVPDSRSSASPDRRSPARPPCARGTRRARLAHRRFASASQNAAHSGSACSGRAAAVKSGRCPRRASP